MTENDNRAGISIHAVWASFAIGFAQILLVATLVYNRLSLVRTNDIELWSVAFRFLLIATISFSIVVFGLLLRGTLQATLRKLSHLQLLAVIFTVVLISFGLPQSGLIPQYFNAALVFWGFFFALGLGAYLLESDRIRVGFSKFVRIAAVITFGFGISLILLEICLRLYFSAFGSQADKVSYLYSVDEALSVNNRYIGMPYLNYALSPNYPGHNSQGFRGTEIQVPKPDGTFRIFALGGSTTYGSSLTPDQAYPAQLEQTLHERGYTNIQVINAGVEAYSSHDSLTNFIFHVLDYEPDMIIVYHAVNDVNARLIDPEVYNGINMRQGIWSTERLEREISPFTLVRFVQIAVTGGPNLNNVQVAFFNPTPVIRCDLGTECDRLGMTPEEVLRLNSPTFFERNLRNMVATASMNGVDIILSTWAYYPHEIERTANVMTRTYYQEAVEEHNEIITFLGDDLNIPVADFRSVMPDSPDNWLDTMHLSALGASQQAGFYADFLTTNDLIPLPPE